MREGQKVVPVIDIPYDSVNPHTIVVGDPDRVMKVLELCENPREVGKSREFWTYNATYKGMPVTIASNGVGAGGAIMCFEGLIMAGAKVMIRVGTGGYLQDYVKTNDFIISTACCREEGVTQQMVPMSYPAVASLDVTNNLVKYARSYNASFHVGITCTGAIWYPDLVPTNTRLYQKAGVVAYENEASALFVTANLRHVKCGCIFVCDGPCIELLDPQSFDHYPKGIDQAKELQFRIALDALVTTEV